MKTAVMINLLTAAALAAPAFAGEARNSAMSALAGAAGTESAQAMIPAVSAPKAVCVTKAPTQAWTAEAKKVYAKYIESGDLFLLPEAKKSELPAAALKQLNKANAEQHSYGPTFAATAYKLVVKGQAAFIVHNDKDGHSLTVHIFDASGKLAARGHADESTPLYWDNLNASSSGNAGSGSGSGGYVNPGYGNNSGPDAIDDGSGNGPAGGGPDDTSWDGCGSTGTGGGTGPDGSGGGVDF